MSTEQNTRPAPPAGTDAPQLRARKADSGPRMLESGQDETDGTDAAREGRPADCEAKSDADLKGSQSGNAKPSFTLRQYINQRIDDGPWQPGMKRKSSDDEDQVSAGCTILPTSD